MAELLIHQEKVTKEIGAALSALCPFSAIAYENGVLSISAACKLCKMCVRKGPAGVIEYKEEAPSKATLDKASFQGIAVYADCDGGRIHPVTFELIGKALTLAKVTDQPVLALVISSEKTKSFAKELLDRGVDTVYTYESPIFRFFSNTTYANAFADFIQKIRPSSVLVGATNLGRSLAPRVACRFRTGLTADCTMLEMKPNSDLVQIRPAFGGNIMAQILTANSRPQFCTVRYKVFPEAPITEPHGRIVTMNIDPSFEDTRMRVIDVHQKPAKSDLSEAEKIIAVGRGLKSKQDLIKVRQLADLLDARLACTRPLVEAGWLDASHQIGLSGKTVKPRLIITLGISGAVQFAAGMKGSDLIIAVNSDENAPIFDIAHYAVIGDLYEITDGLIERRTSHV